MIQALSLGKTPSNCSYSGSFLQSNFFSSISFLIILKWKSHGCKLENTLYQVKSWLYLLDFSSSSVFVSNLNFMSHFQLDPKFSYQKARQETSQFCLLYFHFRNKMLQEKKTTICPFPSCSMKYRKFWHKCVVQGPALDIWVYRGSRWSFKAPKWRACIDCIMNAAQIWHKNPGIQVLPQGNTSLAHLSNFLFPEVIISDLSADS